MANATKPTDDAADALAQAAAELNQGDPGDETDAVDDADEIEAPVPVPGPPETLPSDAVLALLAALDRVPGRKKRWLDVNRFTDPETKTEYHGTFIHAERKVRVTATFDPFGKREVVWRGDWPIDQPIEFTIV